MKQSYAVVLSACVVLVAGLGCSKLPTGTPPVTKAQAAAMGGVSANGQDLCAENGWYEDDYQCDTFCVNPDRTCFSGGCYGLDPTTCTATPGCWRLTPQPVYNPSYSNVAYYHQDPSDICRPNDACDYFVEDQCGIHPGCEAVRSQTNGVFLYCRVATACSALDEAHCKTNTACVAVNTAQGSTTFAGCFPKPAASPCFDLKEGDCTMNTSCEAIRRQVIVSCMVGQSCNPPSTRVFQRCVPRIGS